MSENLSTVWKKSLEPIPSHTTLSLVSLYDLLYDSDGTLYNTNAQKAFKLPHDIICYNTALYSEAGGKIKKENDTGWPTDFVSNGIDISIPDYDIRANLRFVECDIKYNETNKMYEISLKNGDIVTFDMISNHIFLSIISIIISGIEHASVIDSHIISPP